MEYVLYCTCTVNKRRQFAQFLRCVRARLHDLLYLPLGVAEEISHLLWQCCTEFDAANAVFFREIAQAAHSELTQYVRKVELWCLGILLAVGLLDLRDSRDCA